MIKLEKKHVKIFSVAIAAVFIGSIIALALTQLSGMGLASAASTSVGVIDYRQVMSASPELQDANSAMQLAVEEAKRDFEEKSASMNDDEKAAYYQETQDKLQKRQQELFEPIQKKINSEVKTVAETKGLSVVLDKGTVVYGGQDITQDVMRRLAK